MKQQPKPQNWPMTGAGRMRVKHLKERIDAVTFARYDIPEPKDPPAIARARRIVDMYDAQRSKRVDEMRSAIRTAARDVEREMLFAPDANTALEAVEQFEKLAKAKKWPVRV